MAFEGYLQTVPFNFILKQWLKKKVWKLIKSLFIPNPRRKDIQKQVKIGLLLLKGLPLTSSQCFPEDPVELQRII